MILTDICPEGRKKDFFQIYIDGEAAFFLYKSEIKKYKLTVGCEISEKTLEQIHSHLHTKAKNKALQYLLIRPRSRFELEERLRILGYGEDVCQPIIAQLSDNGYINDERFAEMFASDAVSLKKWGPQRIRRELLLKKIDKEIIDWILEQQEDGGNLFLLLQKKLKPLGDLSTLDNMQRRKEIQKVKAFLFRKGYNLSAIDEAIANLPFTDEES